MQSKKRMEELHKSALEMLKENLPETLDYHNYEHTLDVMNAVERIAMAENISGEDLDILRTAAILHDIGYIKSRDEHEEESCKVAVDMLSSRGFSNDFTERVCELIRATKVPHNPKNKLSEILCDADLDYLGREDFFSIGHNVFLEFKRFGVVKDEGEWNNLQINFLEKHKYFTPFSNQMRKPKKLEHLEMLKKMKIES